MLGRVVDQVARASAARSATSTSRLRVRRVLRPNHDHDVGVRRRWRVPPAGDWWSRSRCRRSAGLDEREPLAQHVDDRSHLVNGQGGLRQVRRPATGRPPGPAPRLRRCAPAGCQAPRRACPRSRRGRRARRAAPCRPGPANRRASLCTFATSGQVASTTLRSRRAASARTAGATPCAENTTVVPSGTSSSSSTNTAPCRCRSATTCALCTICRRTYTGRG